METTIRTMCRIRDVLGGWKRRELFGQRVPGTRDLLRHQRGYQLTLCGDKGVCARMPRPAPAGKRSAWRQGAL
eukprot:6236322-Karenia_brevis.AAC.1